MASNSFEELANLSLSYLPSYNMLIKIINILIKIIIMLTTIKIITKTVTSVANFFPTN